MVEIDSEVGSKVWIADRVQAVGKMLAEPMAAIRELMPHLMQLQSSNLVEIGYWTEMHYKLDAMVSATLRKGCKIDPRQPEPTF